MTIQQPYINITGNHFNKYVELWTNFSVEYNADLPNREKLKPAHRRLFYTLIRIASRTLKISNKMLQNSPLLAMESNQPLRISTNRKELADNGFNKEITKRTISNYLDRLVWAGVIKRAKFHGTQCNFELLINPNFLLISDYSNREYEPKSKFSTEFLRTKKQAIRKAKVKIFQHMFSDKRVKTFNNSIITNSDFVKNLKIDTTHLEQYGIFGQAENISYPKTSENIQKTFTENTPSKTTLNNKQAENGEKITPKNGGGGGENSEELTYWQKIEQKQQRIREYLTGAATVVYWYMVENLFPNHDINPSQKAKAIDYLIDEYFLNEMFNITQKDIDRYTENYKRRIDLAKGYIERNNFNTQWIFPVRYLDKDNPKGFVATKKWQLNYNKLQATRKVNGVVREKGLTETEKLNRILRLYAKHGTLEQLNACENYVKNVMPKQTKVFYEAIRQINNKKYA